jgi:hypothetical protein
MRTFQRAAVIAATVAVAVGGGYHAHSQAQPVARPEEPRYAEQQGA